MLNTFSPEVLTTAVVVCIGIFGLLAALMLRSKAKLYWHGAFYLCLVMLVATACYCPNWCGSHFCLCTVLLIGMIIIAVIDISESHTAFSIEEQY